MSENSPAQTTASRIAQDPTFVGRATATVALLGVFLASFIYPDFQTITLISAATFAATAVWRALHV